MFDDQMDTPADDTADAGAEQAAPAEGTAEESDADAM